MAPRRAAKGRSASQSVSRLGLLLLFPFLAGTASVLTLPEVRPDGWEFALCLVTMLSFTAAAMDGFGILVCPMGMMCCMVFILQILLCMMILLWAAGPEELIQVPAGPAVQKTADAPSPALGSMRGSQAAPQPAPELLKKPILGMPGTPVEEVPTLHSSAKLSVVLACANEGDYAVKTASKVVERTPADVLEEVIVVDDGSRPQMQAVFEQAGFDEAVLATKRIRMIRHETTLGLMVAKKTGGDSAKGDILVFLDCHVSPQKSWYEEIRKLIVENPKRMVVPAITDLDLTSWEEVKHSNVNTKTYLTWGADFDWFDDDSPYVPVMSGGLLALSSYWWRQTGGYDAGMRGWGGENLDQSLRSWLCGGEIMRAKSSRVAHMWRTNDPRTKAHYRVVGSADANKKRVVVAWFDRFRVMYDPTLTEGECKACSELDISSIKEVQRRLACKPFVHFLHRHRDVYIEGAVIPQSVFQLREKSSGLCLTLARDDVTRLETCGEGGQSGRKEQLFHWANRQSAAGHLRSGRRARGCCSGIRLWSTDKCLDYADDAGVHTYLCDVTGNNLHQQYSRSEDGRIVQSGPVSKCLTVGKRAWQGALLNLSPCRHLKEQNGVWEEVNPFEPTDTRLYREELRKEGLSDPAFP